MYQDIKSTIIPEVNGKNNTGKRIRELNNRYFFMSDQVEKENSQIRYCPTDKMWVYLMKKATQGETFRNLRKYVLCGNE